MCIRDRYKPMTVKPLNRVRKIKKRTNSFTRFQCEDYGGRLRPSWRKPHGIDNRMRRKFRGNKPLVAIGYGTNKKARHVIPNGFRKFLITNLHDLELLLTNNRTFCGEIAHNISSRKRASIVKRAAELNVRLTNASGKVRFEEKKAENK
eukprot:TRINITY_DN3266_c0_g1_i26.p2 TRINITY_DN3266_c0_g1~~TRINITY_DN3266_c0_g1_i26.p2  ORF type:complete len:149 (+),score=29.19 TRINITY_DN3266_c0_g1_i26:67-513(+)